jgi:hypothetical protein
MNDTAWAAWEKRATGTATRRQYNDMGRTVNQDGETFEDFDRRVSSELGMPPTPGAEDIDWPEDLEEI